MRTRSVEELIRYEATRRPEIASLVERAPMMTDAEIDALDLPMLWYRDGLKAIRAAAAYRELARITLEKLANHDAVVEDPTGTMAVWEGEDVYIKTELGSSLLVPYNKLVWFPDTGGVWIETVFVSNAGIIFSARRFERTTKLGYIRAYKERLLRSCGDVPFTVVYDSEAASVSNRESILGRYGVRFS